MDAEQSLSGGICWATFNYRVQTMLITILIIILVLWLLGSFPRSGAYNANWGYAPIGGGTLIILIVLIVLLSQGY